MMTAVVDHGSAMAVRMASQSALRGQFARANGAAISWIDLDNIDRRWEFLFGRRVVRQRPEIKLIWDLAVPKQPLLPPPLLGGASAHSGMAGSGHRLVAGYLHAMRPKVVAPISI
jgi:hypothetical protein